MFGIIDENKKFILLDSDHDKLRGTALMLAKKEVYTEEMCIGDECIEVEKERFVPMFNEDTVDEAIKEYDESEIETAYTGDSYIKGYAPQPTKEEQSERRAAAYLAEVDPITAHIQRLRDDDPESEEIAELITERSEKVAEIKERYPYPEGE